MKRVIIKKEKRKHKDNLTDYMKNHFTLFISSIILYFGILFVLPYFIHFGFYPRDIIFFDTTTIFIIITSGVILYSTFVILSAIYYLNATSLFGFLKEIKSYNKFERIILYIVLGLMTLISISTVNIGLILDKSLLSSLVKLVSIILIVTLFVILNYSIFYKAIFYREHDNEKNFLYSSFLFIITTTLMSIILLLGFSALKTNLTNFTFTPDETIQSIIHLVIKIIKLIFIFFIPIFIASYIYKNNFQDLVFIIFIIPIIFIVSLRDNYISILEKSYSLIGLSGKKNIFIEEPVQKILLADLVCKEKFKIYEKTYCKITNVNIVWNGNRKIYILKENKKGELTTTKTKVIIPIPKKYLLNEDIIY